MKIPKDLREEFDALYPQVSVFRNFETLLKFHKLQQSLVRLEYSLWSSKLRFFVSLKFEFVKFEFDVSLWELTYHIRYFG